MIENISSDIVKRLLHYKIIDYDRTSVYQYGFEIFISSMITFMIAFVSGVIYKCLLAALIYFAIFALLRSICGGYHAKTYLQCNTIYAFVTSFVLLFYKWIPMENFTGFHYVGLLFSIIVTAIYAPVQNENKPLQTAQKQILRIFSMATVILLSLLSCLLEIEYRSSWCILIDMTLFVVSFSMFITNPRRGVNKNEQNDQKERS